MPPATVFKAIDFEEYRDVTDVLIFKCSQRVQPAATCSHDPKPGPSGNINEDEISLDVSSSLSPESDEVDRPSPRAKVTRLDIGGKWSSIVIQLFDIVGDIGLMVLYLVGGEWSYFVWTAIFVFVPALVIIVMSMRMYNKDVERNLPRGPHNAIDNKLLWCKYYWPVLLLLQLAPLFRWRESLKFARQSYNYRKKGEWGNQRECYEKMLKEDQDIALLRLVECFLEAAPQLILQLSIMQNTYPQTYGLKFSWQVIKIFLALVSLGWCMASFNRNVRLAQPDKTIITKCGLTFQFFWHFFITVSRIISVSVITSAWPLYACVWFLVHWLIMTIWISTTSPAPRVFVYDCRRAPHLPPTLTERIKSEMFASVLGVVFFFTQVNVEDRPTCSRHTFYYALCFVQNVVACSCWARLATDAIATGWYFKILITLGIVPFVLGILSMIVYYKLEPIMKKQDIAKSISTLTEEIYQRV